ncbi:MAG: cadherin repeat domain-containing protein, partial [Verrucomicrobiota bacterium]
YFVNVFDVNDTAGLAYALEYNVPPSPTNRPPHLDPLTSWTLVAGNFLSIPVTAADPDANRLRFTLEPGAPSTATLDPLTGFFAWRPTDADAATTNLIRVRVTDDGTPNLSDVGQFSVVVRGNTAPSLQSIANYLVDVLTTLRVTNVATDVDLPANQLFFSLEPGAPDGASINPTNGLFVWTPSRAQAPSTNLITVTVTDNGSPMLSASQSFTVVVNDYIELSLGSTHAFAGQTSGVPLTLFSSAPVTNLNLTLSYPPERLTNWRVVPMETVEANAWTDPTNAGWLHLTFTPTNGQPLQNTQWLANLYFTPLLKQSSAFINLGFAAGSAYTDQGILVPTILGNPGRVILIARESLLEATIGSSGEKRLIVHGHPETTYWVEYATDLTKPIVWNSGWPITLTGVSESQEIIINTNGPIFLRVHD